MREIQNNTSIPFASQTESVARNSKKVSATEAQKPVSEKPVGTDDLSKSPEAVIGRSQVTCKTPIEKNIEKDINDLVENPKEVEKTMKFFEKASEVTNDPAKATVLAEGYRNEFLK